ncbi:MAG: hypothetical protein KZQ90_19375 [Candidatus Thiodiazotropha sp. (ex Codakia rugifera)]|nr:hypothetical protein [Candidatus Thiodiazotropha sp. (ex Codakia rugifera)]
MHWNMLKELFSKRFLAAGERGGLLEFSRFQRDEVGVWPHRYWEHAIRDELDFTQHLDYIRFNPMKHGLVERVVDWQWSTFHRYDIL